MKAKPKGKFHIGEILLETYPPQLQAIIESIEMEEIAVFNDQFDWYTKSYLIANLTKSELLELDWYTDKFREKRPSLNRRKVARLKITKRISLLAKNVKDYHASQDIYNELILIDQIKKLSKNPDNPRALISFVLAAAVLCRREGLMALMDYYASLKKYGLEDLRRCVSLVVDGVDPMIVVKKTRSICRKKPLLIRLLTVDGLNSLQMGHNPLLIHGRLCCILREVNVNYS